MVFPTPPGCRRLRFKETVHIKPLEHVAGVEAPSNHDCSRSTCTGTHPSTSQKQRYLILTKAYHVGTMMMSIKGKEIEAQTSAVTAPRLHSA